MNEDGPHSISLGGGLAESSSLLPDASLPVAGPGLPACLAREASSRGPARPPSRMCAGTGSPVDKCPATHREQQQGDKGSENYVRRLARRFCFDKSRWIAMEKEAKEKIMVSQEDTGKRRGSFCLEGGSHTSRERSAREERSAGGKGRQRFEC